MHVSDADMPLVQKSFSPQTPQAQSKPSPTQFEPRKGLRLTRKPPTKTFFLIKFKDFPSESMFAKQLIIVTGSV